VPRTCPWQMLLANQSGLGRKIRRWSTRRQMHLQVPILPCLSLPSLINNRTESPEPSTSTQSHPVTARPSTALTPTHTPAPTAPPQTNKKFQLVIGMLHSQIYQLRGGNIFHNPIKKSEAPDYYEIVRRPMDLKTVKARTKDGLVSSTDHFKRDVYLMFANAIMYNRPGTSVNGIAAEVSAHLACWVMSSR
jgi:hypothetical protein